jgi:YVTN family beta-propeller protein
MQAGRLRYQKIDRLYQTAIHAKIHKGALATARLFHFGALKRDVRPNVFTHGSAMLPRTAALVLAAFPLVCVAANIPPPGIKAVQHPFAEITPSATIKLGGRPDWMAVTPDSVWMANSSIHTVHQIDPATNREVARIECPGEPDSGIAAGFGHIWVPITGPTPALIGIDETTHRVARTFAIGPADAEGGIAVSNDSLWMVSGKNGPLLRIDPGSGKIRQRIALPAGSYNPTRIDREIWVTSVESNLVSCVDAESGAVLGHVPTGPRPRFSTGNGQFVWVLNQGDGSVTKIDRATREAIATIAVGVPGGGGEICFGGGFVWVTVFDLPLTKIDARTDQVTCQWVGRAGDAVRFGFDSVWLSNLRDGLLLRLQPLP